MKKLSLCVAVFSTLSLAAYFVARVPRRTLEPVISVTPQDQFIGTLVHGDEGSRVAKVEIANRGSAPLRILRVDKSCGCSHVEFSKREMLPNEKAEMFVHIDGRDVSSLSTAIQIASNDPARPVVRAVVSWRILPPIILEPAVLDLVEADGGLSFRGVTRAFRPRNMDLALSDVDEIRCWPPGVEARLEPMTEGNGEMIEGYTASEDIVSLGHAIVTVPRELTTESGSCSLTITSKRGHKIPAISVAWRKVNRVRANPEVVYAGVMHSGSTKDVMVELVSRDGQPFSISGTRTSVPWIRVECPRDSFEAVQRLPVSVSLPLQSVGAIRETIHVAVTGGSGELVIPVLAWSKHEGQRTSDESSDAD